MLKLVGDLFFLSFTPSIKLTVLACLFALVVIGIDTLVEDILLHLCLNSIVFPFLWLVLVSCFTSSVFYRYRYNGLCAN